MSLPINYATNATIANTDVDSWTAVINALVAGILPPGASLVAGYTTTVTSGSTITLVVTSTGMQTLTGSTGQTVALPTTSVTAGMTWIVSNQSSATATVNASGGATVGTVAAGDVGIFCAEIATPTLATGWVMWQPSLGGITTTALSGTTYTMTIATTSILVFTGTTQNQVVTLPATAALGQQWLLINQGTTATVTCNGSTSGTPVIIAGGGCAVLTANTTTPTTAAGWDVQYGGHQHRQRAARRGDCGWHRVHHGDSRSCGESA